MVPVCGGASSEMSAGSICTRAGFRFFLRIIFRVLGAVSSSDVDVATSSWPTASGGGGRSAMIVMFDVGVEERDLEAEILMDSLNERR